MPKGVEIMSVKQLEKVAKSGKTYGAFELTYMNQGEEKTTTVASFALDPDSLGVISSLKTGDLADLNYVKNANGYFNLSSIVKADPTVVAQSATSAKSAAPSTVGAVDKRQQSIVFQNSMAHATAISIHNAGKGQVKVEDVLALAQQIAAVSIDPSAAVANAASADTSNAEYDTVDVADGEVDF